MKRTNRAPKRKQNYTHGTLMSSWCVEKLALVWRRLAALDHLLTYFITCTPLFTDSCCKGLCLTLGEQASDDRWPVRYGIILSNPNLILPSSFPSLTNPNELFMWWTITTIRGCTIAPLYTPDHPTREHYNSYTVFGKTVQTVRRRA